MWKGKIQESARTLCQWPPSPALILHFVFVVLVWPNLFFLKYLFTIFRTIRKKCDRWHKIQRTKQVTLLTRFISLSREFAAPVTKSRKEHNGYKHIDVTRYLKWWINTLIQYNLPPVTFYFDSVGAFFSKEKCSKNTFSFNSCAFPYQDSLDWRHESLKALPRLYCSRLLLLISPLNIFLCKQSSSSFT